jgi:hypothetical protein
MSNTEAQNLAIAAAAKKLQAESLLAEARDLERRAEALTMPRIIFESDMTVTQAQIHFIHTKAFAMDHGDVQVLLLSGSGHLLVTAGDLRWEIDNGANVVAEEGFDPFDNDWRTK